VPSSPAGSPAGAHEDAYAVVEARRAPDNADLETRQRLSGDPTGP
jgi:hypothetical protein